MKVAPTLLNYSIEECVEQFRILSSFFDRFQIDIQDGEFISNKTISIEDYFLAFKQSDQSKITSSLFDFHLQTKSYANDIQFLSEKKLLTLGVILIHFSLRPDFRKLKQKYSDFAFGLVLNPEDSVDEVAKLYDLSMFPGIQVMSIHPGPQGSPFIPETLGKFKELRDRNYKGELFLDGAINAQTIPTILATTVRPDFFCIGSFLTKAPELSKSIDLLKASGLF